MDPRAIEAVIAERFGLPRAPTLVARVTASKLPVVFTHLRSTEARRRQSMDVPREQSFSFQVPLTPFPWDAWFAGKQRSVSPAIPGNAYLFDPSTNPTVVLKTPFSTVRLIFPNPRSTRSRMNADCAGANGLRAVSWIPGPGHAASPKRSLPRWINRAGKRPCLPITSRSRFTLTCCAPTAMLLLGPFRRAVGWRLAASPGL